MRYRLTAEAEGNSVADLPFVWDAGDYRVGIVVGEKKNVTHVWVDIPILDYREFLPSITGRSPEIPKITIPKVPGSERLVATLQYLESLGSFWLGIERLGWATAKLEWIPESPEEKKELSVLSFSSKLEYPGRPIPIVPQVVAGLLRRRDALEYLTIPMSFYREGINDYRDHKYVSAFYNFYFFIEDLYGSGKTRNRAILEEFKQSKQLRAAYDEAYSQIANSQFEEQREELKELMHDLNCEFSVEGLIEFTVMIRGELHHFSRKSSRPKGHPLNQRRFRSVAYFGMSVCIFLIQKLANGTPLEL